MPGGAQRVIGRAEFPAPVYESLGGVLDSVWEKLNLGAEPKSSDYHVASVATIDPSGWPHVRSVVLRKAVRSQRLVVFHTDVRAPKFLQIQSNNHVSWLFYSRREKIQIRLQTTAQLHASDEMCRRVFDAMPARCQRVYLAPEAPGKLSPVPTGNLPDDLEDRTPTPQEAAIGQSVFGIVSCQIHSIDWLYLAATGHRRALFCWDGKEFIANWANP
jgi:hypothetical protein